MIRRAGCWGSEILALAPKADALPQLSDKFVSRARIAISSIFARYSPTMPPPISHQICQTSHPTHAKRFLSVPDAGLQWRHVRPIASEAAGEFSTPGCSDMETPVPAIRRSRTDQEHLQDPWSLGRGRLARWLSRRRRGTALAPWSAPTRRRPSGAG